jgi:hypothetical protein
MTSDLRIALEVWHERIPAYRLAPHAQMLQNGRQRGWRAFIGLGPLMSKPLNGLANRSSEPFRQIPVFCCITGD